MCDGLAEKKEGRRLWFRQETGKVYDSSNITEGETNELPGKDGTSLYYIQHHWCGIEWKTGVSGKQEEVYITSKISTMLVSN